MMGSEHTANNLNIMEGKNLEDGAVLDNKFKASITTTIPGLLSKILNEVSFIRKGVVPKIGASRGPSTDNELVYDYEKGKFITKSNVKGELTKKSNEHIDSLIKSVESSKVENLIVKDHLSKDERQEFTRALIKYIMDNKTLSPYYMLDDGFIKYFQRGTKLRSKVLKGLNKYKGDPSEMNKADRNRAQLIQDKLTSIKESNISDFSDVAKRADVLNSVDTLSKRWWWGLLYRWMDW